MSAPYTIAAIFALWVLAGCIAMLGYNAVKALRKSTDDAPEPTIEMELAANWRVIRALDTVYDDLVAWENEALDADKTGTALDIMQARALLSERRDQVAAL